MWQHAWRQTDGLDCWCCLLVTGDKSSTSPNLTVTWLVQDSAALARCSQVEQFADTDGCLEFYDAPTCTSQGKKSGWTWFSSSQVGLLIKQLLIIHTGLMLHGDIHYFCCCRGLSAINRPLDPLRVRSLGLHIFWWRLFFFFFFVSPWPLFCLFARWDLCLELNLWMKVATDGLNH